MRGSAEWSTAPLFLSESTRNPGRPLRVAAFNDILERIHVRLDLPHLHPHTLRHQRCTMLKRAGIALDEIALFAGHRSVETTRLYIHMAPTEMGRRIREATAPFDTMLWAMAEASIDGVPVDGSDRGV